MPPGPVLLPPAVLLSGSALQPSPIPWTLFINTRTPLSKLTLFSSQCPGSCLQSCKISNLFSLLSPILLWLLANHTNCFVTLSALSMLIALQPSLTHRHSSNAEVYVWALVSKTERLILQTLQHSHLLLRNTFSGQPPLYYHSAGKNVERCPFKIMSLNLRSKFTLHDTDFVTAPAEFSYWFFLEPLKASSLLWLTKRFQNGEEWKAFLTFLTIAFLWTCSLQVTSH